MNRLLRILRIVVSLLFLVACTLSLTVASGALAGVFGWSGRVQLLPLVAAGSLSGIGLWISATLVFGRIYCSTVCPLGALMDISTASMRLTHRGFVFRHAAPWTRTRLTFLTLAACALIVGAGVVVSLLDPFDNFARIVVPLLGSEASLATGHTLVNASIVAVAVALATFAGVVFAAWHKGRILCNTVCPVGTALGGISKFSMLHFDIDTDRCTHCRKCEYVCKAQCIDMGSHTVDSSRCVVCFDCVDVCPDKAIRWTMRRKRLSFPLMQRISPAPAAMLKNKTPKENATIS